MRPCQFREQPAKSLATRINFFNSFVNATYAIDVHHALYECSLNAMKLLITGGWWDTNPQLEVFEQNSN